MGNIPAVLAPAVFPKTVSAVPNIIRPPVPRYARHQNPTTVTIVPKSARLTAVPNTGKTVRPNAKPLITITAGTASKCPANTAALPILPTASRNAKPAVQTPTAALQEKPVKTAAKQRIHAVSAPNAAPIQKNFATPTATHKPPVRIYMKSAIVRTTTVTRNAPKPVLQSWPEPKPYQQRQN